MDSRRLRGHRRQLRPPHAIRNNCTVDSATNAPYFAGSPRCPSWIEIVLTRRTSLTTTPMIIMANVANSIDQPAQRTAIRIRTHRSCVRANPIDEGSWLTKHALHQGPRTVNGRGLRWNTMLRAGLGHR
jgi:hypothetical protein